MTDVTYAKIMQTHRKIHVTQTDIVSDLVSLVVQYIGKMVTGL